MDSDTLTYLQNSEVWNILEVCKLKPRRDEVTGEWGRLHNEELNDL